MFNFEGVLKDLELLIGLKLNSINPATAPIYLTKIDSELNKYYVASSLTSPSKSRSISELKEIWLDLERKGFTNVDQALYGSGSSRNHPETILANLSYIQFFKFKNKKHLLLRGKPTHPLGSIQELEGSDYKKVRKLVEGYLDLRLSEIVLEQKTLILNTKSALDLVTKKYPGESSVKNIEELLSKWASFNSSLSDAIVDLDDSKSEINSYVPPPSDDNFVDAIDSPSFIGIEEDLSKADQDTDADAPSLEDKLKISNLHFLRIRHLNPVLSLIFDRIEFKDIDLQPDFQRKDRIWDIGRRAKLIESILMRLPLPAFYFAEQYDGSWIVVDGLQRITTIYDFIKGDFKLEKLTVLSNQNGNYYRDLTRTEQRAIREYAITAYLIDYDSSDDSTDLIVELFHRINTYGMRLSEQEIRSALKQGSSVKFLRFLSSLAEFKLATNNKVRAIRQKDMELCLAAIAFMVNGYQAFGNQKYDDFLKNTMEIMNNWGSFVVITQSSTDIEKGKAIINVELTSKKFLNYLSKFQDALTLAHEIFGDSAFVRDRLRGKAALINKQLFEVVITYFSFANNDQKRIILSKAGDLIEELYTAIQNNSSDLAEWESPSYSDAMRGFNDAITQSTGKRVTVLYRFNAFREILKRSTSIDIDIENLLEQENKSDYEY